MADLTPIDISSSSSLNPLPVLPESPSSLLSSIEALEEDLCSICLEPFNDDGPATITACKHEYHLHCILEWSERSRECPICCQLLVLKDPVCQELLATIERERSSRSRKISSIAMHYFRDDFGTEHESITIDSNVDGLIMQHLVAAPSSAHYLRRRERHRSSSLCPSQVLVSTSLVNLTSADHANTASSNECKPHVVNSPPSLTVSPPGNSGTVVNGGVSIKPRFLYNQSPPDLQISTSSETVPPTQSFKYKFSAASARYKESFSKGTRSFKEKLLARNASVKELSKDVHREMSAGIAGVARMIERLDLASKRADDGTSKFNFKGKAVLEDVIAQTLNKHRGKVVDEMNSDATSHMPVTARGRLLVTHEQERWRLTRMVQYVGDFFERQCQPSNDSF